jgi:osmoprotectant transport system permease protein
MTSAALAPVTAAVEIRERSGEACHEDPNAIFCFEWARENLVERFETPTLEHLQLVLAAVALGFVIAFALALLAHQRRWLQPPLLAATGVLYTIPSVAFFFLLLPITGRGVDTAIIALTAFNLQIIYRNTLVGLNNVADSVKDAARGMGLTDRQLLWRVEVPLATPEIVAGLRIATVSTVAIATLAVFAGGGGLGSQIKNNLNFPTAIIIAGLLAILIAILFDVILYLIQRRATPWAKAAAR